MNNNDTNGRLQRSRLLSGRRPTFLPPALAPFLDRVEVHDDRVVTLLLSEPLPLALTISRHGDEVTVLAPAADGSRRVRWMATAQDADAGRVAFGQTPAETLIRAGLSQLAAAPDLSEGQRAHAHLIAAIAAGRWRTVADASAWAVAQLAQVSPDVATAAVDAMRTRAAVVDARRIATERWAGWRPQHGDEALRILHDDVVEGRWPQASLLPDALVLAGMYTSQVDAVRTVLDGLVGHGLVAVGERFAVETEPMLELTATEHERLWERASCDSPLGDRLTGVACLGRRGLLLSLRRPTLHLWVALVDLGLTKGLGLHVTTPGLRTLSAFRADLPAGADLDADGVVEAVVDLAAVLAETH